MKHIGAELRQTSCLPVSSETPSLERHVKPTLQPTSTSGQILRDCNRQDKTASRAPIERFFVALAIVGFAGLIASVVWMLLEHALQFERMAAEKSNPELRSEFEKQVANSSALSANILRSEAWYLIAWSPTAPAAIRLSLVARQVLALRRSNATVPVFSTNRRWAPFAQAPKDSRQRSATQIRRAPLPSLCSISSPAPRSCSPCRM
jgi:hypothetical protein